MTNTAVVGWALPTDYRNSRLDTVPFNPTPAPPRSSWRGSRLGEGVGGEVTNCLYCNKVRTAIAFCWAAPTLPKSKSQ